MALIVQKFGGTSVRDKKRIYNVAGIVARAFNTGDDVVVVVSAQGDTTDILMEKAAEITRNPSAREMDVLLATGEQQSMALLAMALGELGCPAISLAGWQAGFETNRTYGRARIKNLNTERISSELAKRRIVIVAGFQGVNVNDDITTLGRGGSDTSAVAIAAALHADRCQIFTDVDGIYTADPRIVPAARKLAVISFDEMLELATLGAQVLNNRSVELAKKYGVELEVLSSISPAGGTIVKEVADMNEGMLIQGVAKDTKVAVITLLNVPDVPGVSFKIFSLLGQKKINVDIILQASGREGNKDIIFTVPADAAETARELLEENKARFGGSEVEVSKDVAKVSIVGAGMQSHAGVAARMFEALYDANINIRMVSTSEIKISVLINKDEADTAVRAIHAAFMEDIH
ncbi:MAG: aspartate kinase [Oscillospiraceae bacterium]